MRQKRDTESTENRDRIREAERNRNSKRKKQSLFINGNATNL